MYVISCRILCIFLDLGQLNFIKSIIIIKKYMLFYSIFPIHFEIFNNSFKIFETEN